MHTLLVLGSIFVYALFGSATIGFLKRNGGGFNELGPLISYAFIMWPLVWAFIACVWVYDKVAGKK